MEEHELGFWVEERSEVASLRKSGFTMGCNPSKLGMFIWDEVVVL